jgi:hypothetical protein
MRNMVARLRWTSWLAASALAFQVFALVLTTPMEIGRGLAPPAAAQCETEGQPAGHHGTPAPAGDLCQICIGMQVAGQALAPVAPALPLPPAMQAAPRIAVAIEAPRLDPPRPQNPRAPPLPA